jgi:hypothetical protein
MMAGICKRCGGETTNTRAKSGNGLCFGCQHNPCRGVMGGCQLVRRECNRRWLHGVEKLEPAPISLEDRLQLAEEKLAEQGIVWEDNRYVFDGKGE